MKRSIRNLPNWAGRLNVLTRNETPYQLIDCPGRRYWRLQNVRTLAVGERTPCARGEGNPWGRDQSRHTAGTPMAVGFEDPREAGGRAGGVQGIHRFL